jgi:hypothetical protein
MLISTIIMPMTFSAMYTDLYPTHWCYEKILDFSDEGYIDGYSDGTFRPDNTITRAEFVKIVNNFFDYGGSESDISFTDVSPNDWFEPYVREAVARGYIKGYSDGTFKPYNNITRQEALVILARILEIDDEVYDKNHKDGLKQYKDSDQVEKWAYKAVQSYVVHGFTKGNGENVIRILDYLTRAETVGFLNNVEKKVVIKRSGGSSRPTAVAPVISVYGSDGENEIQIKEEQEWIGYDEATADIEELDLAPNDALQSIYNTSIAPLSVSCQEEDDNTLGAYIEMSTSEELSLIYDKIDDGVEELYEGRFFLIDGIYNLAAYATRSGYRNSALTTRIVKIDTKAPQVLGEQVGDLPVAHEQKVNIQVFDTENNGEESKIDTTKLLYKWVRYGEPCTDDWQTFLVDEAGYAELTAPSEYGKYLLAISAYDNAGNHYGCFRDEINHKGDTIQVEQEEEEDDAIHYGFVKQNGGCFRFLEVIVGNNAPSTVEDSAVVGMNGEVLIDVLPNDSDIDGDTLEVFSVEDGSLGSTEIDESGKILYTPNINARGTDSFHYAVSDGNEGYTNGLVTVQIYGLDVICDEEEEIINRLQSGEEDVVENGLKIFIGGKKSLQVLPSVDLLIEEINWENSNGRIIGLNENGCLADVIGRKLGKATLTITANLSNGITAVCYVDVQVIPTIVTIYHVYDDTDYSNSPTEVKDKRVSDVLTVLDYAKTINGYYTATATPETIIVEDDSHEATINYTRKIANVKFVDWDSTIIGVQQVPYGDDATAPNKPSREGYEFIGWSEDFTEVESDLRIVAEYAKNDKNAPTITITGEPLFIDGTASKNNDWGYDWNITVTAVDDNDDVKALRYVWNQNADEPADISSSPNEITSGTVIEKPNVTDTGVYYLHVYAKDFFGNEDIQTRAFNVDRTEPTEPEVSLRIISNNLYLTINADDAHSGVNLVQYRLKNWRSNNYGDIKNYTGEFKVDWFLQAIKISVTDNVGNSAEYEISGEDFNTGSGIMSLNEPVELKTMLSMPTEDDSNIGNQQENEQKDLGEVIKEDEEVQVEDVLIEEDDNGSIIEGDDSNMYYGDNENIINEENDINTDNDFDDSDDLNDDEDISEDINDEEESEENDVDVDSEEDEDIDTEADIDSDNENDDEGELDNEEDNEDDSENEGSDYLEKVAVDLDQENEDNEE